MGRTEVTGTGGAPIAYFRLHDEEWSKHDGGRYLFLILRLFRSAGYCVHLKASLENIAAVRTEIYAALVLQIDGLKLTKRDPQTAAGILVTDDLTKTGPVPSNKFVLLRRGFELAYNRDKWDLLFPYTMHPKFYVMQKGNEVVALRSSRKYLRVAFSGNMDAKLYATSREQFGKVPRSEVIRTLRDQLQESEILEVHSAEGLCLLEQSYQNRFVLICTRPGFRVPKQHWLSFLAGSDFFLAPPGMVMPLSHNIIEGMSVGTIPVTEYPEFFDPPLEDGINAVVYNGKAELVKKMRSLMLLDDDVVREMRLNVIHYFDHHLAPEAFGRKLRKRLEQQDTVIVGLPFMASAPEYGAVICR